MRGVNKDVKNERFVNTEVRLKRNKKPVKKSTGFLFILRESTVYVHTAQKIVQLFVQYFFQKTIDKSVLRVYNKTIETNTKRQKAGRIKICYRIQFGSQSEQIPIC